MSCCVFCRGAGGGDPTTTTTVVDWVQGNYCNCTTDIPAVVVWPLLTLDMQAAKQGG
jgi:hypothetical protein